MRMSREDVTAKKKALQTALTAAMLSALVSFPAFAGRWQQGSGRNSGKWWYNNQDGTYAKDGWFWIDGDEDGIAECYYFDANGWLVTKQAVEGYQVADDGAWVDSGVVQIKSVAGSTDVYTSGANEISTGTLELGSDLELGTEIDFDDPTESSSSSSGKTSSGKTESSSTSASSSSSSKDGSDVISVGSGPESSSTSTSSSSSSSSGTSSKKVTVEAFTGEVGKSASDLPKSDATELVQYARSFIGVLPYVTAGTSLVSGADCSGFTQQIFRHFGITIPRDSRSQYAASTKVSASELQPGDLIFYGSSPSTIYHVGIYSGNGTIIHCTRTGDYVREHNVFYATPYGYGRYTK